MKRNVNTLKHCVQQINVHVIFISTCIHTYMHWRYNFNYFECKYYICCIYMYVCVPIPYSCYYSSLFSISKTLQLVCLSLSLSLSTLFLGGLINVIHLFLESFYSILFTHLSTIVPVVVVCLTSNVIHDQ